MSDNDDITKVAIGVLLGLVFATFMLLLFRMTQRENVVLVVPTQNSTQQFASTPMVFTVKKPKRKVSKPIISMPTRIVGTNRLVQIYGEGRIDEMSLSITNPDAVFRVIVDGKVLINEKISNLSEVSTYSNWIGLEEIEGETAVVISDIPFNNSFELVVSTREPATVKVVGRYEVIEDGH